MDKERFVTCPIDSHECGRASCSEYLEVGDADCQMAVNHLVDSSKTIGKIYTRLKAQALLESPEILDNYLGPGIRNVVYDIAEKLDVDKNKFIFTIAYVARKRYEK